MAVATKIEDPLEIVLEGTSWLEGFRQGREDGFEVGLKLGLVTAIKELERRIKMRPDEQIKLAEELRARERQLDKLGFVRKSTKDD
jgi:hypothetical protein